MDYKERITEEAAIMFRKYGIKSVTMDMIASQLGISKRTIYEVFNDKDELLAGVLKSMAVRQKELIGRVLGESENVIEAIFKLLKVMGDHLQGMSPAFRLDMEKYFNSVRKKTEETDAPLYFRHNEEMLCRGIMEGVFREDLNIDMTNKCLFEVMRLSHKEDVFHSEDIDKRFVFRDFYINYLRGISTPKGLELINLYEKKLNDQGNLIAE